MPRRFVIIVVFFLVSLCAHAQGDGRRGPFRTLRAAVDKTIDLRDSLFGVERADTSFMRLAPQGLGLRVFASGAGTHLGVTDSVVGSLYKITMGSEPRMEFGLGISYRRLSASFSFNPARLVGRNNDFVMDLSYHGNQYGLDFSYSRFGRLHPELEVDSAAPILLRDECRKKDIYLGAYYVFNYKRFAYSAATSQSWVQKRSAGGVLAGASFYRSRLAWQASTDTLGFKVDYTAQGVSLNAGYGHNFVAGPRWMLHVSCMPGIIVYCENSFDTGENRFLPVVRRANYTLSSRLAVIRYLRHGFLSLNSWINAHTITDSDDLRINDTQWRAQLSYCLYF